MLHKITFSNSVIPKLTGPFCQPPDVGYSLNQSPPALIGVKKGSTHRLSAAPRDPGYPSLAKNKTV